LTAATTVSNVTATTKVLFTNGNLVFWNEEAHLKMFAPAQFHIHAPSEHTFNGKHYDLELHIVHTDYLSSRLAVLAIYFDVAAGGNSDNPFLTALQLNVQNPSITSLPLEALVGGLKKNAIYSYEGSLTTPPCSEIVTWIINNEPQPISTAQLKLITNHFAGNSLFAKGNGNNRLT
jgi:carbonic anhydrase